MKRTKFLFLALSLLLIGTTANGYAAPVEHTTNAARETTTAPDAGEPGKISLDEAVAQLHEYRTADRSEVVATYRLTNAGDLLAENTVPGFTAVYANDQPDSAGGGGAEQVSQDDLDEIVDEALDHWYERPVGESIVAWIGWIVAAALLLWRAVTYFKNKDAVSTD